MYTIQYVTEDAGVSPTNHVVVFEGEDAWDAFENVELDLDEDTLITEIHITKEIV